MKISYDKALSVVAQVLIDLGNNNLDDYAKEILAAIDKKSPCWTCFFNEDCKEDGDALLKKCSDFYGLDNMVSTILYVDALVVLRHKYPKLLSMAPNRRLDKVVRETSEEMNDWGLDFLKAKLKAIGIKKNDIQTTLTKMKIVKIKNIGDIKKGKWDKKFKLFHESLLKIKSKLINVFEDKYIVRILKNYNQSIPSAINMLSKYNRLPIEQQYKFIGKNALKSLKKQDPDKLTNVLDTLTQKDKKELNNLINPSKTASSTGPITPKTHPEYYTKDGNLRLVRPIKDGTFNLKYNAKWTPQRDKGWYAQGQDPDSEQWCYFYTEDYMANKGKSKFADVTKLQEALPKVRKNINKDLKSKSKKDQLLALIVHLVDKGGFRIGNNASEVDDVRGLHNLQVKHIKFGANNILKFDYTGKKLKNQKANFKVTKQVFTLIKKLIKGKGKNDYLFTINDKKVSPASVNNYLESIGSPATIHKFRHVKSTKLAKELLLDNPNITKDDTQKDKKIFLKEALKQVQEEMGHESVTTTKKHYIDPKVIDTFMKIYNVTATVIAFSDAEENPPMDVFIDMSTEDVEKEESFNKWLIEVLPEVMDEKDPLERVNPFFEVEAVTEEEIDLSMSKKGYKYKLVPMGKFEKEDPLYAKKGSEVKNWRKNPPEKGMKFKVELI